MSVSYGATGTVTNTASASPTVAYPSGISAGDMLILACYIFEAGGATLSPSGWTFLDASPISSSVQVHVFYKEATGSESGSLTVPADATVDIVGHITRFSRSLGAWDTISYGTGAETGSADPTEWTVTTSTSVERIAGDMMVAFGCGNTAALRTWSSETIAGASATAIVNTLRTGVSLQGHTAYATAPSTANNAVSHIADLNTNQAGNGLILRLRDLSTHTDFRGWGRIPIKADS